MRIALIALVLAFMATSGWADKSVLLDETVTKIDTLRQNRETFQSNAVSDSQKAFIAKKINKESLTKNIINDDAKFAAWFKANFQEFLANHDGTNAGSTTGETGNKAKKEALKAEITALRDEKKKARKTWEDAKDRLNAEIKTKQTALRAIDPKAPETLPEQAGNDQLLGSGDPLPAPTTTLQ